MGVTIYYYIGAYLLPLTSEYLRPILYTIPVSMGQEKLEPFKLKLYLPVSIFKVAVAYDSYNWLFGFFLEIYRISKIVACMDYYIYFLFLYYRK